MSRQLFIVTGASRGMGAAIAEQLLAAPTDAARHLAPRNEALTGQAAAVTALVSNNGRWISPSRSPSPRV